jgi:uncharacterized protein YbjT (DUF2867 family)
VIQVSALGADAGAASRFHLSKRAAADGFLATLNLEWVIVQPAFVYGLDGTSRMFRQIASLPLLPVPGSGQQSIQPIHIDDLCLAMVHLLVAGAVIRRRIPLISRTGAPHVPRLSVRAPRGHGPRVGAGAAYLPGACSCRPGSANACPAQY